MHLIVILIIVLVIFRTRQVARIGGSIGKAIKGFKRAMEEPDKKPEEIPGSKKPEDKKE